MSARRMNQSQLLKEPQGTVQAYVMHEGRSNWGDFFGKRFIKKGSACLHGNWACRSALGLAAHQSAQLLTAHPFNKTKFVVPHLFTWAGAWLSSPNVTRVIFFPPQNAKSWTDPVCWKSWMSNPSVSKENSISRVYCVLNPAQMWHIF